MVRVRKAPKQESIPDSAEIVHLVEKAKTRSFVVRATTFTLMFSCIVFVLVFAYAMIKNNVVLTSSNFATVVNTLANVLTTALGI